MSKKKKVSATRRTKVDELLRVYGDLEHTLRALKTVAERRAGSSLKQINVKKLVAQLNRSKRDIERKISGTFQSEKTYLKKKWNKLASHLGTKPSRTTSRTTAKH